MKQTSTLFLKSVVALMGLAVIGFEVFTFPTAINQEIVGGYLPILIGMYISSIPFLFALYQALKILSYIDKNKAFSSLSISSLKNIKYCALIIAGMYSLGLPYIYVVADRDDAPGVILLAMIFVFASVVVATLAAVLEKLVENAVTIQQENELTV